MANRVGEQLGNYCLTRLLGQGGFAEVYLSEHVYLNTLAALKADSMERFAGSSQDAYLADLADHFYMAGACEKAVVLGQHAAEKAYRLNTPQAAIEQVTRAPDAAQPDRNLDHWKRTTHDHPKTGSTFFYVPLLQKSPCFPACNLRTVHDGSTRRSGYNRNVGQDTIPTPSISFKSLPTTIWVEKGPSHERKRHFEVWPGYSPASYQ